VRLWRISKNSSDGKLVHCPFKLGKFVCGVDAIMNSSIPGGFKLRGFIQIKAARQSLLFKNMLLTRKHPAKSSYRWNSP
jgi:hypothetical protein